MNLELYSRAERCEERCEVRCEEKCEERYQGNEVFQESLRQSGQRNSGAGVSGKVWDRAGRPSKSKRPCKRKPLLAAQEHNHHRTNRQTDSHTNMQKIDRETNIRGKSGKRKECKEETHPR